MRSGRIIGWCGPFSMPRQVLSNEAMHGPRGRAESSTSTRRARRSLRDLLSGLPKADLEAFLEALSPNALMSLPWLFEHWAIERHQLPPEGDWTTWVILGGRGAGKTRAGAEWVRAEVEGGKPGDPAALPQGRRRAYRRRDRQGSHQPASGWDRGGASGRVSRRPRSIMINL